MASAQVHQQQTEAAPEQAEKTQQQAAQAEEREPSMQIQEHQNLSSQKAAPMNETEGNGQPNERGHREKQEGHVAVESQEPKSVGKKRHEVEVAGPETKSPESAQLRARRLAVEAEHAQAAALQASKLAAEKLLEAQAAAKEAADEANVQNEEAKPEALEEVDEVTERASKQQKISSESPQNIFLDPLQTIVEEAVRQAAEQKSTVPHEISQSSDGADVAGDVEIKNAAQQLAVAATETVQRIMQTTVDKSIGEMSPQHEQNGAADAGQPNAAADAEVPSGSETPTQPGQQVSAEAVASVPVESPAAINGIQDDSADSETVLEEDPFGLDYVHNPSVDLLGKARQDDMYRITSEDQSTEQGPVPMQVG